jgi:ketosteroid isomerase-like protein
MTRPSADLIADVLAAWNRRDLDALLACVHPAVEYVNAPSAIEPGTRSGRAEVGEVFRKQWEGLGHDARLDVDELHPVGADVVTVSRLSRTLPGSTTRFDARAALRWSFRDGLVARIEVLGAGTTFRDGLAAAGLS